MPRKLCGSVGAGKMACLGNFAGQPGGLGTGKMACLGNFVAQQGGLSTGN